MPPSVPVVSEAIGIAPPSVAAKRYFVVTTNASVYAKCRHHPLSNVMCVVQDAENGEYLSRSLLVCQSEAKRGEAIYDDRDWFKGIHPIADARWMGLHCYEGYQLAKSDFALVSAICHPWNNIITVFIDIIDEQKKKSLLSFREEAGYEYDGPVRCSLSQFKAAGGSRSEVMRFLRMTEEDLRIRRSKRNPKSRTHKGKSLPCSIDTCPTCGQKIQKT